MTLVSLAIHYNSSEAISTFVSQFESEWLRLYKLAKASKDDYGVKFASFLDEDKAKRDFLLSFLVKHNKNVVDNLSTKDNFTYPEVKQRILDLDATELKNELSSSVALSAVKQKNNKFSLSATTKSREYTGCAKYNLEKQVVSIGLVYYMLKNDNEESKTQKDRK